MSDRNRCQIGKSIFIIDLDLKSYRKHVNQTHMFFAEISERGTVECVNFCMAYKLSIDS